MPTYGEALQAAKRILGENSELAQNGSLDTEAEQLLMASFQIATGKSLTRMDLFSQIADPLPSAAALDYLLQMAQSRACGKPLQYLTGVQVFLDHEYQVGSGVLVPRPETEVLLVTAVSELSSSPTEPKLGFEIGIGSGILSIELLSRYPNLTMMASELTDEAQEYALANAKKILGPGLQGEGRLQILRVDSPLQVLEPFSNFRADFLITNPPYIARGQEHEIDRGVAEHEPSEALFAPSEDALYFYRKIVDQVENYLKPCGYVFAEIPHERASTIAQLFEVSKWELKLLKDLNQRDRVLVAKLRES